MEELLDEHKCLCLGRWWRVVVTKMITKQLTHASSPTESHAKSQINIIRIDPSIRGDPLSHQRSATSCFWKVGFQVITSLLPHFFLKRSVLRGQKCWLDADKMRIMSPVKDVYESRMFRRRKVRTVSNFCCLGLHGWAEKHLPIMSSNLPSPDNFPFWHPAFKWPAPGCYVAVCFWSHHLAMLSKRCNSTTRGFIGGAWACRTARSRCVKSRTHAAACYFRVS